MEEGARPRKLLKEVGGRRSKGVMFKYGFLDTSSDLLCSPNDCPSFLRKDYRGFWEVIGDISFEVSLGASIAIDIKFSSEM